VIRRAFPADLDALAAIEESAFAGDRISRRSMRRLIKRPSAILLVLEEAGLVRGYALLLTRKGSRSARLYSLAMDPSRSGKGAGSRLLKAVEENAAAAGLARITLEVREDNAAAIALYRRAGYAQFGRHEGYYADGAPALRFGKALEHPPG
jgi:ribosomal protein S18 acetylase RimI-like enzyme